MINTKNTSCLIALIKSSLNIFVIKINKLFNSPSTISLFIWETRLGKDRFQIEALTLIQNIMERSCSISPSQLHIFQQHPKYFKNNHCAGKVLCNKLWRIFYLKAPTSK